MLEEERSGWLNQNGEEKPVYCTLTKNVLAIYEDEEKKVMKSQIEILPETAIEIIPDSNGKKLSISSFDTKVVLEAEDKINTSHWINSLIKKKKSYTIDDFDMISVLGKGFYGKVLLVQHKITKHVFAMKVIPKSKVLEKEQLNVIFIEKEVLAKAKSPFIEEFKFSFQSATKFYFGLEYIPGGELFYHMLNRGTIPINEARLYIAEIAIALNYLHSIGYIYRDMKPENVMLDAEGHVVLADFGLCKDINVETHSFVGTLEYMAPEIVVGRSYGKEVDFWALGILLYEMLTENTPFYHENRNISMQAIVKYSPDMESIEDEDARDLIYRLLAKDPKYRYGYEQIRKHRFFRGLEWEKIEKREYQPKFVPSCKNILVPENVDKAVISESAAELDNNEIECDKFEDFSETYEYENEQESLGKKVLKEIRAPPVDAKAI